MWLKGTGEVRSINTVFFRHKHTTKPTFAPVDAIVHAAKEVTEVLKGNISNTLEGSSLEYLAKLETIFSQQVKQYKEISEVRVQPTRVQEEHISPSRAETTRKIQQTQPVVCEPVEREEDTHTGITEGMGIPTKKTDGEKERNKNSRHYITQDEEDTPAFNTHAFGPTLTQKVIFSCMYITSTPATPRNLASRNSQ